MTFLERFHRRAAAEADTAREQLDESLARVRRAETDLSAAERRSAYAQTRLNELSPDLREEARLEIEANLKRAQEVHLLAQQALGLHRQLHTTGPELASPVEKNAGAARELAARDTEYANAIRALDAIRIRIQERDAELRSRFGLG